MRSSTRLRSAMDCSVSHAAFGVGRAESAKLPKARWMRPCISPMAADCSAVMLPRQGRPDGDLVRTGEFDGAELQIEFRRICLRPVDADDKIAVAGGDAEVLVEDGVGERDWV